MHSDTCPQIYSSALPEVRRMSPSWCYDMCLFWTFGTVHDLEVRFLLSMSLTPRRYYDRVQEQRKYVGDEDHEGDAVHLGSTIILSGNGESKHRWWWW